MMARSSALLVCVLAVAHLAAAATVAPGWTFTPYVQTTGQTARSMMGQAWDANGDYYAAEGGGVSTLYKFQKSALPFTGSNLLSPTAPGLAFSKAYGLVDNADGICFRNGRLYLAQATLGRIVEVDVNNGDILRTVATKSYPLDIKVDPLSGDLFFSSLSRGLAGGVYRISNVEATNPTLTRYASGIVDAVDGISFAADGTLYASSFYTNQVLQVSRPGDSTPVVSVFASVNVPDGTAVGICNGEEVLMVVSAQDQAVYQYKLSDATRTRADIVTGASSKLDFAFVGPDNAFYISQHNDASSPRTLVQRLFNPNCVFTQPPPPGPQPSACGANCPVKTVSNSCGAASFTSTGSCATLDFSNTVQSC